MASLSRHISSTLIPLLLSALAQGSIITLSPPTDSPPSNIPLLIWHGLGDAFDADGIKSVGTLYQSIYPNASVHAIALGTDTSTDRRASWLGSVPEQLQTVCSALTSTSTLSSQPHHPRPVNALGFSQGGQFLRGLIETCPALRVQNLVTFGAQHNGIAAYQECGDGDWFCSWVNGIARSNTWGAWTQANLVPAQYFRDPADLPGYLDASGFLADVNNERRVKKAVYKERLARVGRFVMYVFTEDEVVHPRESSWFAEVNATTGDVTPLRKRPIYKEDWIGLRALDERGALFFAEAPGAHMNVTQEVLTEAFEKWMAPEDGKPWRVFNDHGGL